jgi:hypothetical protein
MINNILFSAAVAIPTTLLCAPVFANNITSPKQVPVITNAAFSGLTASVPETRAPAIALHEKSVTNNIACRNVARNKFFELGARNMSSSGSNDQWGIVGNMNAVVWCRDNRAIIVAAGSDYEAAKELRDELSRAF